MICLPEAAVSESKRSAAGHPSASLQMQAAVPSAVSGKLKNEEPFDIIFLDPPYQKGLEEEALKLTAAYDLLNDDGLIIIETLLDTEYDGKVPECFYIEREKKYKSNKHLFLRKR